MDIMERRCDACGAGKPQTIWRYLAPIAIVHELRLCGNHTKRHAEALLAADWRLITDTRPPLV